MKKLVWSICLLSLALSATAQDNTSTNRPKIGLVLGGGGALGMSHIGVLRVLEEQQVPIDYIAGTSMGSIIAGLYASGMSPDEIEAFLVGLDWNEVMSDDTPRRELFFRRKLEDQRYLFDLGVGRNGIKMGTGLAAGQKFNNLMQLQVQRVASVTNFNDLSIPFRAVATDLVSGKPYVIDHGNLARAMRASMAVPGVFTAVELEGHLLVDGGIVNNLPVDVVEAMGADIIIAVDVGSASDKVDPKELRSIGGVLGRTYAIAQRPEQLENFNRADIGLQPELEDFTASQFERVAELIPKGEEAALKKVASFRELSISDEDYTIWKSKHRRPAAGDVVLDAVKVSGNNRVSTKAIEGRIYSRPGQLFDVSSMEHDLMRIYGIGEFEQVLYTLEQDNDGSGTLNYITTESPAGPLYLSAGFNLRSDFDEDSDWNILLNLTRRSINPLGAEWRNEVILGSVQSVLSEYYQPLDYGGIIFMAPIVHYRSETQNVYDKDNRIAEYDVERSEARLDFGVQLRHYAELRVGPAWGQGKADVNVGSTDLPDFDDQYFGPMASLIVDRLDKTYFARDGYYFALKGTFPCNELGGEVSYDKVEAEGRLIHSLDDHTFLLNLQYGESLGSDLPGYAQFTLGGAEGFSGLAEDQFRGSTLGVISAGYRYRLMELPSQVGSGIYAMTRFDTGNVWDDHINSDLRYGFSAGFGIDSIIGPVLLTYGLADGGYDRVYFSIGSVF